MPVACVRQEKGDSKGDHKFNRPGTGEEGSSDSRGGQQIFQIDISSIFP